MPEHRIIGKVPHQRPVCYESAQRHASAQRFAQQYNIGHYAKLLKAPAGAGPSKTGLDLVKYQQRSCLAAFLAKRLHPGFIRCNNATLGLHGFCYHTGGLPVNILQVIRRVIFKMKNAG